MDSIKRSASAVADLGDDPRMLPVEPRGPLSDFLCSTLPGHSASVGDVDLSADVQTMARDLLARTSDVIRDDDVQLSLFLLYGLHYGSLPRLDASWEWHPDLIAARGLLERSFEQALRTAVDVADPPKAVQAEVADWLFAATAPKRGPSLAQFVAKSATVEHLREFLVQRSIYTLREADPHSWAIPRLTGRTKAALMEIQADEYGGGDPSRMHSAIFAQTMRGLGLDDTYAAYIDQVPAITLASQNMMSMFGVNRRLLGAVVGHLAAFEMTSSIPNRLYGDGFRRLGFGRDVTWYFDEHVEADAVHEQIAARDLAGSLAEDSPDLLDDILFGAMACLTVDGWVSDHILESWQGSFSSLRSSSAGDRPIGKVVHARR